MFLYNKTKVYYNPEEFQSYDTASLYGVDAGSHRLGLEKYQPNTQTNPENKDDYFVITIYGLIEKVNKFYDEKDSTKIYFKIL